MYKFYQLNQVRTVYIQSATSMFLKSFYCIRLFAQKSRTCLVTVDNEAKQRFQSFTSKAQFFVLQVDECLGRNETQHGGNWDEVVTGRGLGLLCRHDTFGFLRANEPSCGGLQFRHILKK